MDLRTTSGVSPQNLYIFGLPGLSDKRNRRLYAYAVMRKYANLCGAKDPSTLRGTNLRKHIASLLADHNLSDSDLTDLAHFLGHEEKIHKDHYRQRANREILVVSQFLEKGNKPSNPIHQSNDMSHDDSQENISVESTGESYQRKRRASDVPSPEIAQKKQKTLKQTVKVSPKQEKLKIQRKLWTEEEKDVLKKNFCMFIEKCTYPSLKQIREVLENNKKIFTTRTEAQAKAWFCNLYKLSG